MGYFDTLSKAPFKELDDNSVVFYPYNKKYGYILTPEKVKKAKRFIKEYQTYNLLYIFFISIFSAISLNFLLDSANLFKGIVCLIIFAFIYADLERLIYHLAVKKIVGNSEKIYRERTKQETKEIERNIAKKSQCL